MLAEGKCSMTGERGKSEIRISKFEANGNEIRRGEFEIKMGESNEW
jgi:hypothetical protein